MLNVPRMVDLVLRNHNNVYKDIGTVFFTFIVFKSAYISQTGPPVHVGIVNRSY